MSLAKQYVRHLVGERGERWYRFAQHVYGDYRRFMRDGRPHAAEQHKAPHSIELYERLVRHFIDSPDCVFVSMEDLVRGRLDRDRVNVILRHDVDGFPERLHLFYEVESRLGVRSTFYVLPSEADYRLSDCRAEVTELKTAGFEVALHTTAWGREDPKTYFEWEMNEFRQVFGFEPSTFTLHGYRPWTREVVRLRARFMQIVPELLERHPACAGTDYGRPDTLVISDSAFPGEVSRWPVEPPATEALLRGGTVKFLTHPNYWEE